MLTDFSKELQAAAEAKNLEKIIYLMRNRLYGHYIKLLDQQYIGLTIDDVMSELVIKIWQTLESYDKSKSCYHTYITRILRNKYNEIIKCARRRKHEVVSTAVPLVDEVQEGEFNCIHIEVEDSNIITVENKIFFKSCLTNKEMQAVKLITSGFSRTEASKVMRISQSRISQLLSQAAVKWLDSNIDKGVNKSKPIKTNRKGEMIDDNSKRIRCYY